MTTRSLRLPAGGRLDRSRPIEFTFDGRVLKGFAGDSLASALLANGVRIVGRSFKYHRPRGLFAAGHEEPNAIVRLGEGAHVDPTVKATEVELVDGLSARSLHRWPSLAFDLGEVSSLIARFIPAGFYYKTFKWPRWTLFEPAIRRAAGTTWPSREHDPDCYEQATRHCDVLVVGGGVAGVAAARAAVLAGAIVLLVEDRGEPGGFSPGHRECTIDSEPPAVWIARTLQQLSATGRFTLLTRTMAVGVYDHASVTCVERMEHHAAKPFGPRMRTWTVLARQVVVAAGWFDRPPIIPGNDRPGVMLAAAARRYLETFAVAPGTRPLVFAGHDSGYALAEELVLAGVPPVAVIDPREEGSGEAASSLRARSVEVLAGARIARVLGRRGVRGVEIADASGGTRKIAGDCLLVTRGWTPAVHLHSQSGGRLRHDEARGTFVAVADTTSSLVAGAAAGEEDFSAVVASGHRAGLEAAGRADFAAAVEAPHCVAPAGRPFVRCPDGAEHDQAADAFVDLQNDVTAADIALAARENFRSVEHMKRYTTAGMATDQGKTSSLNAIAVLARETGRGEGDVGVTTYRPPFVPVPFGAVAGGVVGEFYHPRKLLPAHDEHLARGAVMGDYAHWQRPEHYGGEGAAPEFQSMREALAVREVVGVFDASSLGKIVVKGPDAAAFLEWFYTVPVASLRPGAIRYGLMLDENGVITDDGLVIRLAPDRFLLSPTTGRADWAFAWLQRWHQTEWPHLRVAIENVTANWATIAVAGPRSRDVVRTLDSGIDLDDTAFPHMALREVMHGSMPLRIQRVSFTGERQYELSVPVDFGASLWRTLHSIVVSLQGCAAGLLAWDLLRLEKGYIHVGIDTDGGRSIPNDIGLAGPIARKVGDFIGRRSLLRVACMARGREQLVGFLSDDASAPLPVGARVISATSEGPPFRTDGFVSSSAMGPGTGRSIAIGLLADGRERIGERIRLFGDGRLHSAIVSAPLFHDPHGVRLR